MEKGIEKLDDIINSKLMKLKETPALLSMTEHQLKRTGSRMMARMSLLVCNAICGNNEKALPLAAAMELFHNFSLIHDDIIDEDELRRGQEAVWKKWGMQKAIVGGDCMLSLAYQSMIDVVKEWGMLEVSRKVLEAFNLLVKEVFEGECMDIDFEGRVDVSIKECLKMIEMKSGASVGFSSFCGAISAGAENSIVNSYTTFGRNYGIALQIKNDLIDMTSPDLIGKGQNSDIKKRKKTIPVTYALESASGKDLEKLIRYYEKRQDEGVCEIPNIFKKVGAFKYAEEMASMYKSIAMTELKEIGKVVKSEGQKCLYQTAAGDFNMGNTPLDFKV
ncbi:geranylgeranyl diphosphate synthase type I/geranylgeranyl diphosphate synthase type II [Ruminiclostridium sufflavum DSM 19573]|uniref:Geranylgeranyl diphosphate synthase type I/geranylgeranyl diphosphate synthase type II n=1 Tax=Ruminiclostridium sufflavum DSM 19573 TaxID=1121337 RepID=A0A318XMN9_9FIRM|nr:polyprenyl synthetase family protein [Ruminiclostridium sufflavum]PYG88016.1 geranylgeranyl diphosphate synthase type I/geranylgeranyl diphosphate synthase type II [Ruminiclostridium sufflavum DSM 19573]